MTIPFNIEGAIALDASEWVDESAESVAARIVGLIERQNPKSVSQNNSTVEFAAGLFRLVYNWNILVQARHDKIVCIAAALFLMTFFTVTGGAVFSGFASSFCLGCILFLGNYFLASFRFPGYLVTGLNRSRLPGTPISR